MFLRRAQKFNFSYDEENDDLFLYKPRAKSKGSVEMGDLVLDYNSKKEFVGLQIMNASKMIKDMSNEEGVLDVLVGLNKCKVETIQKEGLLIIKIHLFSESREIVPVLSLPNISVSSPALASA